MLEVNGFIVSSYVLYIYTLKLHSKSKKSKSLQAGLPSLLRELTCHGITQCYLPPGRGDIPTFTPAEAGTQTVVHKTWQFVGD